MVPKPREETYIQSQMPTSKIREPALSPLTTCPNNMENVAKDLKNTWHQNLRENILSKNCSSHHQWFPSTKYQNVHLHRSQLPPCVKHIYSFWYSCLSFSRERFSCSPALFSRPSPDRLPYTETPFGCKNVREVRPGPYSKPEFDISIAEKNTSQKTCTKSPVYSTNVQSQKIRLPVAFGGT